MTSFYGPIAGIEREDGSASKRVEAVLTYSRSGCDSFRPLAPANIDFTVRIAFISGSEGSQHRSIEVIPLNQIDDLIVQLKAIKGQVESVGSDNKLLAEFTSNAHQFKLYIVRKAIEDKRAEIASYEAQMQEVIENSGAKKYSAKKRIQFLETLQSDIKQAKMELARLEVELSNETYD